jgi:hypothetical protein
MELNAKYWIFHRKDYKYWSYITSALTNIILLFPIRYAICWCCVLIFTTLILLLMIGHVKGQPLSHWRWNIIYYLIKPFARLHMLCSGVTWLEEN